MERAGVPGPGMVREHGGEGDPGGQREFSWGEWGYFLLQKLEVVLMAMDVYWAKTLSSWSEKGHRETSRGPKVLSIAPIRMEERESLRHREVQTVGLRSF